MSEVREFLAAKNTKFAKAYGPRNPKLTKRAKPFIRRGRKARLKKGAA